MADKDQCQLLGGIFAAFIQGCLAVLCIGTLIIKRQNEIPRRDWYVWFLDVTKQGVGSSFGHFSNIFLSVIIAQSISGGDECQWYCLTYVTDSTIGTIFNLLFLYIFEKFVSHFPVQCSQMNFGEYGDPPQCSIFMPQLMIWLAIVIFGKIIILLSLVRFIDPIDQIMSAVFVVFRHNPRVELVMVMIVIPTILNTVQFWVTDTFLKRQDNVSHSMLVPVTDLDEELISEVIENIFFVLYFLLLFFFYSLTRKWATMSLSTIVFLLKNRLGDRSYPIVITRLASIETRRATVPLPLQKVDKVIASCCYWPEIATI
jgi:hypothetical protein